MKQQKILKYMKYFYSFLLPKMKREGFAWLEEASRGLAGGGRGRGREGASPGCASRSHVARCKKASTTSLPTVQCRNLYLGHHLLIGFYARHPAVFATLA